MANRIIVIRLAMVNDRQKEVLEIVRKQPDIGASLILKQCNAGKSLITIKRDLSLLVRLGFITSHGAGRSVVYRISTLGMLANPIDAKQYCAAEQDKRTREVSYNLQVFSLKKVRLFHDDDIQAFNAHTKDYKASKRSLTQVAHKKELERFIIELSWKSSQIEGNTYTLLDTERLIKEGIASKRNSVDETTMILNHKKAFDFILQHLESAKKLNLTFIEMIHKILVKDLRVKTGLRKNLVRITGSNYRPLDNYFQINEALQQLCVFVNKCKSPYEKALFTLVGLSYIQPFEDGNKRTARLVANAVLLAYHLAPLSYRNVDEVYYKEAMLTFYETNSLFSIKEIFTDQYLFSCRNYSGI